MLRDTGFLPNQRSRAKILPGRQVGEDYDDGYFQPLCRRQEPDHQGDEPAGENSLEEYRQETRAHGFRADVPQAFQDIG